MKKFLYFLCVALSLTWSLAYFLQPLALHSSDLGRHITNGRLLLEKGELVGTNRYSYITPDYPVVNHHWLFGVLVYELFSIGSFELIMIVNALLALLVVLILFFWSKKRVGWPISLVILSVVFPLIGSRPDPRPEIISLFFLTLLWVFLEKWYHQEVKHIAWVLTGLFLCMVLWVNTHLFFIFGLGLVGAYSLLGILYNKNQRVHWFFIGLTTLVAVFITPFGLEGTFQPFLIFGSYEYQIAENQSLYFMWNYSQSLIYAYSFVLLGIGIVLSCILVWHNKKNAPLALFSIVLFLGGFSLVRLTSFAALALYLVSVRYFEILIRKKPDLLKKDFWEERPWQTMAVSFFGLGVVVLIVALGPQFSMVSLKLPSEALSAQNFLKETEIKGPIFNNYDSGGYLIFSLEEKMSQPVFTDNRPEAYPPGFFTQYIKIQEDDEAWQAALEKHDFSVIVFYWRDQTPWAQKFLLSRDKDPAWIPVYRDSYMIIWLRDIPQNQDLITRFGQEPGIFKL